MFVLNRAVLRCTKFFREHVFLCVCFRSTHQVLMSMARTLPDTPPPNPACMGNTSWVSPRLLLGVCSTPMLLQWHVKDPGHSAESASGRLHANMLTLTQRSRSGLTMPLSRHSVGTSLETGAHTTCQGMLGHSRLSLLCHCGLILA